MKESNIIPECFVDTRVAEITGKASREYNHQHGCGNVANLMKTKLQDKFALGIIDEDIGKGPQPKYFSDFNIIRERSNLVLKGRTNTKHYLIIVQPEIEKWLLGNAESVKVKPEEYGLPVNMEGFKQITKTQKIDKNIGFHRFIKELIQRRSPGLITLAEWISLFNVDKLDSLASE